MVGRQEAPYWHKKTAPLSGAVDTVRVSYPSGSLETQSLAQASGTGCQSRLEGQVHPHQALQIVHVSSSRTSRADRIQALDLRQGLVRLHGSHQPLH